LGNLHIADYAVIAAYFIGMLLIGWWYARRQKNLEDYFLGGRKAGALVVGISMIATLLSAISYLATPGEIIKNGPGYMATMLCYPFAFAIVGYLVIPHIMKFKVTSAYELLEFHFGLTIRKIISALFVLIRLLWMGLVIYTCSKASMVIIGMPEKYLFVVLIVVGAISAAYTVMGGISAVIITDVVQFIILAGGAVFTLGFVMWRCGVTSIWPDWSSPALQDLRWPTIKLFSLDPYERLTVFSAVFSTALWWVMVASSDQLVIQRYLCTRDRIEARSSFRNCLLGSLLLDILLFSVGFALVGYFLKFPGNLPNSGHSIGSQADDLFPHFIGAIMPQGLSGLVVAALFAASMSSISSGINSIATVLMTDFECFGKSCRTDPTKSIVRARNISLAVGILSILLSHIVQYVPGGNLLEVCMRLSYFFEVPIFVLFFMAFFVPFSTPAGGWTAIGVGFFSGLIISYWQPIFHFFDIATGDFSVFLICPVSCIITFIAATLVSALDVKGRQKIKTREVR